MMKELLLELTNQKRFLVSKRSIRIADIVKVALKLANQRGSLNALL